MAAVVAPAREWPAGSWRRVAVAMFAVGWGANQFSPLLIEYRHDLALGSGTLAGIFGIYAATLIPGLLIGGPVSDRIGRRPVVLPFVVLSPLATLMLMLGPRSVGHVHRPGHRRRGQRGLDHPLHDSFPGPGPGAR